MSELLCETILTIKMIERQPVNDLKTINNYWYLHLNKLPTVNLRLSVPYILCLYCTNLTKTYKSANKTAVKAHCCVWVWLWKTSIYQGSHTVNQLIFAEADFQHVKDIRQGQPSHFLKNAILGILQNSNIEVYSKEG